jgi:hypothetical protein
MTEQTIPILLDKKPSGVVLSASQLNTWDLCKRRWAFEYVLKIRTVPNESAQLGTAVHAQLEKWLRNATPPDDSKAGQIAKRMLKHLPPPGTGEVERRFWVRTALGHSYTGIIDWTGLIERPTVIDHKTTGDSRWMKTEADLHLDTQANIYAIAGMLGFESEEIDLFWNYGETKKRFDTHPVKVTEQWEPAYEKFQRVIEPTAAEVLYHHAAQTDPHSFPPTVSACSAYGGCPHQSRCRISDLERMRSVMNDGQGQGNMATRMAALMGSNGAQQPQQPAPMMPQQFQPQPALQQPQPMMPQMPQPMAPQMPPMPTQAFSGSMPMPMQAPGAPPAGYAPEVAPNPPESGRAALPAAESAGADATEDGGKKGRGRPAKTLTIEQQVFLVGVHAGLVATGSVAGAMQGGAIALETFVQKFGK